jgi:hypothetical protein
MVKALKEIGSMIDAGDQEVATDTRVRVAFAEAAERRAQRKFSSVSRKVTPINPLPLFDKEPKAPPEPEGE